MGVVEVLTALLIAGAETGISSLVIIISANTSTCTFLLMSQGQSFWSCPSL